MRLATLLCLSCLALAASPAHGASTCPVGKAPTGDFKPFGNLERTGPALVIGCGKQPDVGRFELVTQRARSDDWRGLVFDAHFGGEAGTGPLGGYWIGDLYPKKGDPIRPGGMGGSKDSWRQHTGVTSSKVARVIVRYKLDGKLRSRRMTLGRIRGAMVDQLDLPRALGYYVGWVPPKVKLVDVVAQDREGEVLGRDSLRAYNSF